MACTRSAACPTTGARDSTVNAIVSVDRSLLPNDAKVLAADMDARIVASGPRELDSLVRGSARRLRARRRRRRADPQSRLVPHGQELLRHRSREGAEARVVGARREARRRRCSRSISQKHGRYPEKVSFVIWGDETMRHEGVLESQIF